jgi:hypothetical protein
MMVPDRSPSRRLALAPTVLALLALGALALAFFWKIALTNRVLVGLDVFTYFYPYRDYVNEALRQGRLPLWNPHLFMGAPLLANSQAAVLYPLHWPLIWLDTPKHVAWSIVLHVWLAGAGSFLFARRVTRLRPIPSFAAAALFGLGGFLGAQVEHLNQLNASAWLPWLLLCVEAALGGRFRWPALLAGGAVTGLILLAGHTQAAYIVFAGAAVYALVRVLPHLRRHDWSAGLGGLASVLALGFLGVGLAAIQLLPTLELSGLSVRSGGLPYNEAASFSLKPTLVFKAFLPPYLWQPPFSEYVAYIGLAGLILAGLGAWAIIGRARQRALHRAAPVLVLALVGLFLAFGAYNPAYYLFYRIVPGFALFRAPARWLLLYAFGISILAGAGLQWLSRVWPRRASLRQTSTGALLALVVLELLLGSRKLAYNQPTAPAAYHSLRTAPSHLLADASSHPFRFLSMSDISYDPGDLADLQAMYRDCLSGQALYDLIVATKMKEVLAFNLPLRYRLSSVDGYDGGLLPTARYVTLERLFLDEDEIWPDGRLRQQLRQVPPSRLLSLLNVKYVLTDKTQDVWIDDVYYDLEHTVPLGQVRLADLPSFESTHLGVASYLTGTARIEDGTPVAQIVVTDTLGTATIRTLHAGEHTAEGRYDDGPVAHKQARVGHRWRDEAGGYDYVAVLDLGQRRDPAAISVHSLLPAGAFHLRGLSLIDAQTDTSRNLSVHPAYRLVHSGDVKIYENVEVLPRAFVVPAARLASDEEEALRLLQNPDLDPSSELVLVASDVQAPADRLVRPDPPEDPAGPTDVEILAYGPEQIRIRAGLQDRGYLLVTDAYYPGGQADIDGQPATILRADLYFRAIPLEPGLHEVTLRYQPSSLRLGAWITALTLAVVSAAALLWAVRRFRRRR